MGIGKVLKGIGNAAIGPLGGLIAGKSVGDMARDGNFGLTGLAFAKKKKSGAANAGAPQTGASEPAEPTMKRGGSVKKNCGGKVKYAKGGSVSSRADGIARQGKTNCKIC